MALLNAELSSYEAQEGFDLLPPGWYDAEIVDSEIKEGAKGNYINWTFQIIGKPNKVWEIQTLGHEVGLKKLKTLAVCAGHPNPNFISDTEELHGKKCKVRLKIEKDETGKYEDKNRISAFKPMDASNRQPTTMNPPTPQQGPWPTQPQAAAPLSTPPPAPATEPPQPEPVAAPAPAPAKKPWE